MAERVNDREQAPFGAHANEHPARLLLRIRVFLCQCQRIKKRGHGFLEAYAMLLQIRGRFLRVPLDNNIRVEQIHQNGAIGRRRPRPRAGTNSSARPKSVSNSAFSVLASS